MARSPFAGRPCLAWVSFPKRAGEERGLDTRRKITRFYGVIIYYDISNGGVASIGKRGVFARLGRALGVVGSRSASCPA